MSTVTNVEQTNNKLVTNYDVSKFLLGFNDFTTGDVTASGSDVELTEGLVMGRISATGKLIALDKDATDGSQYPVGVCIVDQTVADGETATIKLVNKGRIASSKITISDGTLNTAIGVANNQKILKDWLNDLGLILMGGEELTVLDNQ